MSLITDLNADLGEGAGHDDELLSLVTSANIACGFHASEGQMHFRADGRGVDVGDAGVEVADCAESAVHVNIFLAKRKTRISVFGGH